MENFLNEITLYFKSINEKYVNMFEYVPNSYEYL